MYADLFAAEELGRQREAEMRQQISLSQRRARRPAATRVVFVPRASDAAPRSPLSGRPHGHRAARTAAAL